MCLGDGTPSRSLGNLSRCSDSCSVASWFRSSNPVMEAEPHGRSIALAVLGSAQIASVAATKQQVGSAAGSRETRIGRFSIRGNVGRKHLPSKTGMN